MRGLFLTFGFVIAAFFPFLALYLDGKGLSGSDIGLVIAAMAVARIVLNPLWGHLADATLGRRTSPADRCVHRRRCFGLVLAGVDGVVAIAVAGFFLAARDGEHRPEHRRDHARAPRRRPHERLRQGALVGEPHLRDRMPHARAGSSRWAGIGWAMPAYAVASLLVFAWSFTVPRDTPRHEAATGGSKLGTVGAVFHEAPRFWGFLVAVFLVWTGFNAAWNFIALKIASEGGGPLLVGIGTAVGGLVEVR